MVGGTGASSLLRTWPRLSGVSKRGPLQEALPSCRRDRREREAAEQGAAQEGRDPQAWDPAGQAGSGA